MADRTPLTAAAVLAARWNPMDGAGGLGVIRADIGDGVAPGIITVDQLRLLSDADAGAVVEHLIDLHNATLWKSTDKAAGVLSEVETALAARAMHLMSAGTLINTVENEACELAVDDVAAFRKRDHAEMRAARKGPIRARAVAVASLAVALVMALDREAKTTEAAHG